MVGKDRRPKPLGLRPGSGTQFALRVAEVAATTVKPTCAKPTVRTALTVATRSRRRQPLGLRHQWPRPCARVLTMVPLASSSFTAHTYAPPSPLAFTYAAFSDAVRGLS